MGNAWISAKQFSTQKSDMKRCLIDCKRIRGPCPDNMYELLQLNNGRNTRGANLTILRMRHNTAAARFLSKNFKMLESLLLKLHTSQSVNILKNISYKHFELSQRRGFLLLS